MKTILFSILIFFCITFSVDAQTFYERISDTGNAQNLQRVTAHRVNPMNQRESCLLQITVSEGSVGYRIKVVKADSGYGWNVMNTMADETNYTDGDYASYYKYKVFIHSSFFYFNLPN